MSQERGARGINGSDVCALCDPCLADHTMIGDTQSNGSQQRQAVDKKLVLSEITGVAVLPDGMVRFRQQKADVVLTLADVLTAGSRAARILQLAILTTSLSNAERARILEHDTKLRVQSFEAALKHITAEEAEVAGSLKITEEQLRTGQGLSLSEQWVAAHAVTGRVADPESTPAGDIAEEALRQLLARQGWKTLFQTWAPHLRHIDADALPRAPYEGPAQGRGTPRGGSKGKGGADGVAEARQRMRRGRNLVDSLDGLAISETENLHGAACEAVIVIGKEDIAADLMDSLQSDGIDEVLERLDAVRDEEIDRVSRAWLSRAVRAVQDIRPARRQWKSKCDRWQDELDQRNAYPEDWSGTDDNGDGADHRRRAQPESALPEAKRHRHGGDPQRLTEAEKSLLADAAATKQREEARREQEHREAEERKRKAEQAKAHRIVPVVNHDGTADGHVFERVLEATGTLGVVYVDNLRGKEVDDVVRRLKLLFAHSNHDAVWKEIQQACDPKPASNSVMLVADQESINRVLDGNHGRP